MVLCLLLSPDFRALFLQGLFAAVFHVMIGYFVITWWGLLWRPGPLQCREYSPLMPWGCHGDRLPGAGPAAGWEFTVPRRVCELDGVVTRDASGSHFLGPLKGSGVWENWLLIPSWAGAVLSPADTRCLCCCVLLLCSSRPERLLQKIILTAWPLE